MCVFSRSSGNLDDVNEEADVEQQQESDDHMADDGMNDSMTERTGSAVHKKADVIPPKKKQKTEPESAVDDAIVHFLKKKTEAKPVENDDNVSDFMKSMTFSITRFPPHIRSDLMYKIHGLVHQAEMQHHQSSQIQPSVG